MSRQNKLTIAILVLLGVSAVWGYRHMARQRSSAEAAAEGLRECRRLAANIKAARQRPAIAADAEAIGGEIQAAIEQSAASAGIAADKLSRITPEPAGRLADTVYKEKPTHVRLTDVTLKQLTGFLHTLATRHTGLTARSIDIRAPKREDTGPLWIADVTVTYLIYDPPITGADH
jgi:hypothetical protein